MSLRFGLIGTGNAARLFAGAFAEPVGGARLTAVCSRSAARAEAFAAEWGIERPHTDWRAMVESDGIDAVCLAAPTGSHAEMAVAAARAGKHVLTEKPIAAALEQADEMIEACRRAGVQLGVTFMYRFMDTALHLKAAVDGGLIGRPLLAECWGHFYRDRDYYDSSSWRGSWEGEGGGSLMTQTSHTLDLMIWIMGDVEKAAGFWTTTPLHDIEVDDLALGSLRFRSGALGIVVSSTVTSPPLDRGLTIYGERGTVGLRGDRLEPWEVPGGPDEAARRLMKQPPEDRGDTAAGPGYADPTLHRRQIADFAAAVAEDRAPLLDGHEGRRTLEVMAAIYRSSDRAEVVELPLRHSAPTASSSDPTAP